MRGCHISPFFTGQPVIYVIKNDRCHQKALLLRDFLIFIVYYSEIPLYCRMKMVLYPANTVWLYPTAAPKS